MKKVLSIIALVIVFASSIAAQNTTAPAFQDFLAQFPSANLPYTLDAQDLQQNLVAPVSAIENRLDWDFYAFLPELERSAAYSNTMVYPEPVAKFETESHFAVLYNIARGRSLGNTSYAITIFGKDGQYVATNFVAGANAQNITAAKITENLQALVAEYKTGQLVAPAQTILNLLLPGNPDQIDWNVQLGENRFGAADSK